MRGVLGGNLHHLTSKVKTYAVSFSAMVVRMPAGMVKLSALANRNGSAADGHATPPLAAASTHDQRKFHGNSAARAAAIMGSL